MDFTKIKLPDRPLHRLIGSFDITERELALHHKDVLDHAREQIAQQISQEIERMILFPSPTSSFDLEKFIRDAIKQEVREQVRKAVADRVEEIVDDILND